MSSPLRQSVGDRSPQTFDALQQLAALSPAANWQNCTPQQLLEQAVEVLSEGDFQTRWDMEKLLGQLFSSAAVPLDAAIDLLLDLLHDEDAELAWFAVRILGQVPHPDLTAILVTTLKTTQSDELKAMIAEALANRGSEAVVALSELLDDADWRLLAVRSLSQIRHSQTIAPLLQVAGDADAAVRAAAVQALSSFHDDRIPPVLLTALADVAALVRREAAIGLGLRTDLTAMNLVEPLKTRLWDFDLDVCRQAAIALGRFATPAAADALFAVLQSPHTPAPLQIEAVRALSWINSERAIDYLQQQLKQSDPQILPELIAGIGRTESADLKPQAAQILIDLLESDLLPYPELRQTTALHLGQLKQIQALEPLIQLLAEPNSSTRLHTIAALKQLDPTIAHQKLEALFQSASGALKEGVSIALAEW